MTITGKKEFFFFHFLMFYLSARLFERTLTLAQSYLSARLFENKLSSLRSPSYETTTDNFHLSRIQLTTSFS